jgi:hypothetical protein
MMSTRQQRAKENEIAINMRQSNKYNANGTSDVRIF